eukprot:CAMPEP_0195033736 /NCGR_PEP_ID=MMETSP0326_2-20130528/66256_2 /TAXON_ID=2866 ORGANISM="Crypthecodinium cohnii, Strain Seligo" /NCGR_SAMPLE_ID=MMETSP0326_2 /ASSEMBLY_ACC=CAM_ASM_000348 /LENGTH=45 /DNA_ID= /DNA_START= /DNA_END= /DNA_ORIENTATION=
MKTRSMEALLSSADSSLCPESDQAASMSTSASPCIGIGPIMWSGM